MQEIQKLNKLTLKIAKNSDRLQHLVDNLIARQEVKETAVTSIQDQLEKAADSPIVAEVPLPPHR